MRLAKSTMLRRSFSSKLFFPLLLSCLSLVAFGQDNSPYSRYGLGNQFPATNVISRSMGGVSAAYSDYFSVNYNNPASYARFQTILESRSKKMSAGRVIFDVGVNLSNRTLTTPNTPQSFTSSDVLFSHVFVGMPIRKNWGLTFGLRPLTRISYNIYKNERLVDPVTHLPIDSASTQFVGSGGSFLPTIGTGFGTGNFSVGINAGYLFGKRESITRRALYNDSIDYSASNHTTNTSFGSMFFNAGAQYNISLGKESELKLGVSGNWKQNLNATQDLKRYTYARNTTSGGESVIDSVYEQQGQSGVIAYPSSYTAGFIYERKPSDKIRGWSFGLDYASTNWDQYRFMGTKDSVQSNHEIRIGGQLTPVNKPLRYGQAIAYRFGFFTGQDYIKVQNEMPVFGVSFGIGLPIVNYNRLSQNQYSVLNLGLEFIKRGNDQNLLKENLFRFSAGLNFTDLWFGKRKYE